MPVSIKSPVVASITAQERFAQSINSDMPEQSMVSYQEFMHQHAMKQFEVANASSRAQRSSSIDETPIRAPLPKSDSTSSVTSITSVSPTAL
jgi:hypothetical protein